MKTFTFLQTSWHPRVQTDRGRDRKEKLTFLQSSIRVKAARKLHSWVLLCALFKQRSLITCADVTAPYTRVQMYGRLQISLCLSTGSNHGLQPYISYRNLLPHTKKEVHHLRLRLIENLLIKAGVILYFAILRLYFCPTQCLLTGGIVR